MDDRVPERPLSRSESKARTRELVLDGAYRVFAEQGYEDASMTAIARDAGVAVGSVYTHFATKRDLFLAVLLRRFSLELGDAETGDADIDADDLTIMLGKYQERLRSNSESAVSGALQAEMWLFAMRDEAFRDAVAEQQLQVFETILGLTGRTRGRIGGEWALSDAEYSIAVVALFRGLVQLRRLNPDTVDPASLGRIARVLFLARPDEPLG